MRHSKTHSASVEQMREVLQSGLRITGKKSGAIKGEYRSANVRELERQATALLREVGFYRSPPKPKRPRGRPRIVGDRRCGKCHILKPPTDMAWADKKRDIRATICTLCKRHSMNERYRRLANSGLFDSRHSTRLRRPNMGACK